MNDYNENNRCWYCGKVVTNDQYNAKVPLYKVVSRSDTLTSSSVEYQKIEVSVTRCHNCYKSQKVSDIISTIILIGIILGAIFVIIYFEGRLWWLIALLAFVIIVIYLILFAKFSSKRAQKKGVKNSLKEHPAIEAFIAEGWSFNKPQA